VVQLVGFVTWRFRNAKRLVDGVPKILVRHGRVNNQVMNDEQVTRAELLEALRREGHASLRKVRFAFLENDGSITFAMRQS
jgi:uncharacterized membrane protein YcaP (DUF421 family)